MMKFLYCLFGMGMLLLLLAPALTSAQQATAPVGVVARSIPAVKITKMSATAKVLEISETVMKVERTIKGTAFTEEYILEKPAPTVNIGDKVRISYVTKDNQNMAVKVSKVAKITPKKVKKETRPAAPAVSTAPVK